MIGRKGDFFTSVSVGNLFGQLLAFQFAEWLAECQTETRPVQIVEAGAHRGDLARDILTSLRANHPALFQNLQYGIVEPSSVRQQWQAATLAEFSHTVTWASGISSSSPINGIIFANELLDAMPIRRFGWDATKKAWFEWGVALNNGQFVWTRLDSSSAGATISPPFETNDDLLAVLPDGFTFERCLEAETWWQNAAGALHSGKLMTIDYGLTDDELAAPERRNGTLRAYYRHHLTDDLLARPGEQDLTAHVNFSALIRRGEGIGLQTELFDIQSRFLTKIFTRIGKKETHQPWAAAHARQFQTLTHPDHLGGNFRVLIQSRRRAS